MEKGTYFKINNVKKFYNQLKKSEFILNIYNGKILSSNLDNSNLAEVIDATYILIPESSEKEPQDKKDAKERLIKSLEFF